MNESNRLLPYFIITMSHAEGEEFPTHKPYFIFSDVNPAGETANEQFALEAGIGLTESIVMVICLDVDADWGEDINGLRVYVDNNEVTDFVVD